jgi:hypothetical protein
MLVLVPLLQLLLRFLMLLLLPLPLPLLLAIWEPLLLLHLLMYRVGVALLVLLLPHYLLVILGMIVMMLGVGGVEEQRIIAST